MNIHPSVLEVSDGSERLAYMIVGKPLPSYEGLVDSGTQKASQSSIVFCVIVRDGERFIPRFSHKLSYLIRKFSKCRVLFYENDSKDRTLGFLRRLEGCVPEVSVYSETLGTRAFSDSREQERTTNLANARNILLDKVKSHYSHFDYYGVIDIDVDWNPDGVMTCFAYDDWDMLGAQGVVVRRRRHHYYDTWAFRKVGHPDAHPTSEITGMVMPLGSPLVRVWSVFGGIGIYKMSSVLPYRYEGHDCEHVCLHLQMVKGGHDKIFLNPSMFLVHRR